MSLSHEASLVREQMRAGTSRGDGQRSYDIWILPADYALLTITTEAYNLRWSP